jgi:hypothetical protein
MANKSIYNIQDYPGCDLTGATYSDKAFLAALADRASFAAASLYGAGVPHYTFRQASTSSRPRCASLARV